MDNLNDEIIKPNISDNIAEEDVNEIYEISDFKESYILARKDFELEKFKESAIKCEKLLGSLLVSIIDENFRILSNSEYFMETYKALVQSKNLIEQPLRDICRVFDDEKVNFFKKEIKTYTNYSALLNSYNYEAICELIEYCKIADTYVEEKTANPNLQDNRKNQNDNKSQEKEINPTLRLGVQQILNVIISLLLAYDKKMKITPYHLLANFSHMTDEITKIRDSHTKLTKIESKLSYIKNENDEEKDKREFEWIRFRGMLINKGDESRNIAFKVETFVNILSSIYDGIANNIKDIKDRIKENDKNFDFSKIKNEEEIRRIPKSIIFNAGYQSGINFGWTMHEIIQKERHTLSLDDKISKWCGFDSDVGFGKLGLEGMEIPISDLKNQKFSFKIKLSDNFVVYKRDVKQVNLCSFIAGYIQGVLEKVTQQPLKVKHSPQDCEQFVAGQTYCIFNLETDESLMKENFENAEKEYNDDLEPANYITEKRPETKKELYE